MRAQTINQEDEERIEDSLAQVLNLEDVFYGFNEFFHNGWLKVGLLLVSGGTDNVDGTAVLFDSLLGSCGESVSRYVQLAAKFSLTQNLNQVFLFSQTIGNQNFRSDFRNVGLLENVLQRADVDGAVFHTVDVLEAALRQDSVDRHLAAFETDLAAVTGTRLCALVTTGGGAALAGALSTSYSFATFR